MSTELNDETKALLATMTEEEREAYLEGLDDDDMQGAIADAEAMSEEDMKRALSGKDDENAGAATDDGKGDASDGHDRGGAGPGDAAGADDGADGDQASAKNDEEDAGAREDRFRPVLQADVPADAAEIKGKLVAAQDENERKFRDGEIDFEAFKAQDRKLAGALTDLREREFQARIYADQQHQTAQQEWLWQVKQFMRQAKKEGIDYESDAKLHKDLDMMVRALAADPDNVERDHEFFLGEAHKRVMALRGIAPKAQTPAADARAQANRERKPPTDALPKTVGDLPGGGGEDGGGGEFARLDKLTGDAFERAYSKLSPDQQRRYLEG